MHADLRKRQSLFLGIAKSGRASRVFGSLVWQGITAVGAMSRESALATLRMKQSSGVRCLIRIFRMGKPDINAPMSFKTLAGPKREGLRTPLEGA